MLTEYRRLRGKIKLLNSQIDELQEQAESLGGWPEGDRVQSSHDPDKIGAVVARLSDLMQERLDVITEATERMNEIEILLRSLDRPEYGLVLQYHYIRGMTWEQVGREMHYDPRWLRELRNRALRALDERIDHEL